MTFTISFGWWTIPTVITCAAFIGWRVFGIKSDTRNDGWLPDVVGCLFETIGYLVAALLSVCAWLIWAILRS